MSAAGAEETLEGLLEAILDATPPPPTHDEVDAGEVADQAILMAERRRALCSRFEERVAGGAVPDARCAALHAVLAEREQRWRAALGGVRDELRHRMASTRRVSQRGYR